MRQRQKTTRPQSQQAVVGNMNPHNPYRANQPHLNPKSFTYEN